MADDNVIRATTQLDTSGLASGGARAEAIVEQTTATIKAQYKAAEAAVKEASANMAQAAAAFGPAAAAGNEVAQAALKQYEAELATATLRQAELNVQLKEAQDAARQAASGYTEARLAARAMAQEAGIPLSYVLGQLAAQSESLRPLLAGLFDVAVAGAFVDIAVHVGESLHKWYLEIDPISVAEKEAAAETKGLANEASRLADEIERLNLKTYARSYGEAAAKIKEAGDMQDKLATASQKVANAQQNVAAAQLEIDRARKSVETVDDPQVLASMEELVTAATIRHMAAVKALGVAQQELTLQQAKQADALTEATDRAATDAFAKSGKEAEAAKEAGRQYDEAAKRRRELASAIAGHEIMESLRTREAQMRDLEETGREIDKQIKATQNRIDAISEYEIKEAERVKNAQMRSLEESGRLADEQMRKRLADEKQLTDEARAEAQVRGSIALDQLQAERALAEAQKKQHDASVGGSSTAQDVAYLQRLKEIDAQIIAEKLKTANAIRLIDEQAAHDDPTAANKDKVAKDIAQMAQIMKQGQVQMVNDTTAIVTEEDLKWKQFFQHVNQYATQAFDVLISHQKNWKQQFDNILKQAELSFANMVLQNVLKYIEGTVLIQAIEKKIDAVLAALHLATASKQVTANAAANAAITAQDKAAGEAQSLIWAGVAAAAAYAANAALPPPIPDVAAANAFASAETWGQLETGTNYVPKTGPYTLHEGEQVTPKKYNPNAGGSGSGGHSFHYHAAPGASSSETKADMATSFAHFKRQARAFNR